MKKIVFIVSSLLVLLAFNYAIYQKEKIITSGDTVFLKLAPVDPRSLMQGDYMQLRYAIEDTPFDEQVNDASGYLVITPDADKVAVFTRYHKGEALSAGEKLIRYRAAYTGVRIAAPDSFMFQEGHAAAYALAEYGILKFDDKGNSVLVGLANQSLAPIEPPQ